MAGGDARRPRPPRSRDPSGRERQRQRLRDHDRGRDGRCRHATPAVDRVPVHDGRGGGDARRAGLRGVTAGGGDARRPARSRRPRHVRRRRQAEARRARPLARHGPDPAHGMAHAPARGGRRRARLRRRPHDGSVGRRRVRPLHPGRRAGGLVLEAGRLLLPLGARRHRQPGRQLAEGRGGHHRDRALADGGRRRPALARSETRRR